MLERLLTKLKALKPFRFHLNDSKFHTNNPSLRLSSKYVGTPGSFSKRILKSFDRRVINIRQGLANFRLNQFAIDGLKIRKYINIKTIGTSVAGSVVVYLVYEYNPYRTKILLYYDKNEMNEKLVSHLSYLHNKHYYPSLLCITALLQAIVNKNDRVSPVRYIREPIILADGGQITLDWALPTKKVDYVGTSLYGKYYPYQPPKDNKILFIIHGLTGGSETNYIQTLVEAGRRKGYRVVVMNQRGVNQPLVTLFPPHGGRLDDLAVGLSHVRKNYPNAPIVAIGTSFGGNQLIRYLSQVGDKTNILSAVVLSAPFDLDDCVDAIENTVYEDFFIRSYYEKNFLPNFDIFQSLAETHGINLEEVIKVRSLRDFHSLFTVKLFNHKDVREYFSTIKILESHIKNIEIPLFMLHSKDDPIAVHKSIPKDILVQNPNIIFAETSRGGHICWFTGLRPKRWYADPTLEFLDKTLELKQSEKTKT